MIRHLCLKMIKRCSLEIFYKKTDAEENIGYELNVNIQHKNFKIYYLVLMTVTGIMIPPAIVLATMPRTTA
jgi:hypothetical protein